MIRFDATGGVAEILLDNPPVNAITDALMDALMATLREAGRVFDAREAMAPGLVSRTAPAAEVLNEAHRLAQVFVGKSPALMKLGKAAFTRATDNGYRQGAASAVDLLSTVFGTDDCREGLAAFAARRRPTWRDG